MRNKKRPVVRPAQWSKYLTAHQESRAAVGRFIGIESRKKVPA